MGTPEFSIPSLERIVEAGYNVPLVVTAPDKPRGRGREPSPCPVKKRALELGLDVASPERLGDSAFLERLRAIEPDVICVVAFRILPESVYSIARLGAFNLHGSLLPRYRGAAPIQRAIMHGEDVTGVTTFFLKKKVDTGNVIARQEIPIGPTMTGGELHDVMKEAGADLVLRTIRMIERGAIEPTAQNDADATPAPKIHPEDCAIDWRRSDVDVYNQIRALSPRPGARTVWNGTLLKILGAHRTDSDRCREGEILIEGDTLLVGTGGFDLALDQIQREGKRSLDTPSFLRGTQLTSGDVLGKS
jgi:methionyl-tRNA formyltransferase